MVKGVKQLKKLLKSYIEYLKSTASENTVNSYMGDLEKFFREIEIKTQKDLKKIRKNLVEEYINTLKTRGMAYSSISRTIASLRKFFLYCIEENVMSDDFTKGIETPKVARKLPNTMSAEEVVRLIESPDVSTIKGIRDKAMLEMMYATGAKVSEIINLRISDVSLKNEIVIINSGGKHRFIPLGKACVDAMLMYLQDARVELLSEKSGDTLFLNFYGQPMTRQGFWKIVKKYITDLGIGANVTPQTIRHSFALHLLKNGADADSVSEMLGYSDVSSTKIYIDVMNNKIKEVYRTAHPRA